MSGLLPKTKDGWMQVEYTLLGIVLTTLFAAFYLVGMKLGFEYGLAAR